MKIGFFGAAREVTGSCFLVEVLGRKLLIDCGFFQGIEACSRKNYEDFGFEPSEVDAICITHAHLDHHGRLPRLFEKGADAPIYSTAPTRDIAELILEDAYNIMNYNSEKCELEPLYSEKSVERVMKNWKTMAYRDKQEVLPGVFVTFFNSGHILGASFIMVEADGHRVVFSGDVGNADIPILPDTDPLPANLDLIVCESTYGDRLHTPTKGRLKVLREVVEKTMERGGVLMIPAFSVERTQELLFDLNTLVEGDGVKVGPVFLDSPLGIGATELYEKYREELELTFPDHFTDDDFFQFPGLEITETVSQSKRINGVPAPKIIVAGSGMMNAGRIQHHLLRYLDDAKNTLLIIGYQGDGTLGRKIQDGAKAVDIYDYNVAVRAEVLKMDSYSAHADYDKLTGWIKEGGVSRVVLVHGDMEAQEAFSKHLKRQGVESVEAPEHGSWITL